LLSRNRRSGVIIGRMPGKSNQERRTEAAQEMAPVHAMSDS